PGRAGAPLSGGRPRPGPFALRSPAAMGNLGNPGVRPMTCLTRRIRHALAAPAGNPRAPACPSFGRLVRTARRAPRRTALLLRAGTAWRAAGAQPGAGLLRRLPGGVARP